MNTMASGKSNSCQKTGEVTWEAHTYTTSQKLGILLISNKWWSKWDFDASSPIQSKSRFVRTSGATSVHTYSTMPIQLEEIFTQTAVHWLFISREGSYLIVQGKQKAERRWITGHQATRFPYFRSILCIWSVIYRYIVVGLSLFYFPYHFDS